MEFKDAVRARRMIRSFSPASVDETVLDGLLADALRSPSAGQAHGVDLLVLTQDTARSRFWELISEPTWRADTARSGGLMAAPVIIVPVGNPNAYTERYSAQDKITSPLSGLDPASWPVPYWTVDTSFAAMSLLLGAVDAGLGALFFHLRAREDAILNSFAIPRERVLIGAIAIGHPRESITGPPKRQRQRFDWSETVHREHWISEGRT